MRLNPLVSKSAGRLWVGGLLVFTTLSIWAGDRVAPTAPGAGVQHRAANPAPPCRPPAFEERVKAQEAIKRVYYRHRNWPGESTRPKPSFEEAVPRVQLEAEVADVLRKCDALARWWGKDLTQDDLQSEVERMRRDSHAPEVLQELFGALGDDPVLIRECLARPILADRLLQSFYARDPRIHGGLRREAETALTGLTAENFKERGGDRYQYRLFVPSGDAAAKAPRPSQEGALPPEAFARIRRASPPGGAIGPLEETRDAFVIRRTRSANPERVEVESIVFPKKSMKEWLEEDSSREPAPSPRPPILFPEAGASSPGERPLAPLAGDTWTATGACPAARRGHTAIWTGSEMIVWGGLTADYYYAGTGARYTPATDTWATMTVLDAPAARERHAAVWTGTEMVVWGGEAYGYQNTGGRYNPVSDTWTAMTTVGAPSGRMEQTALWTGTEMVVWGGEDSGHTPLATGGRYNPSTDSWSPTTPAGAPSARYGHTAVWTGAEMIVWGGQGSDAQQDTGARYAPATDTWTATSLAGAPSARRAHAAVWTGTEMIVWGGYGDSAPTSPDTGGRYNPVTDSWAATATFGAPSGRQSLAAFWTGTEMIVWGGYQETEYDSLNTGGRYNPVADAWLPTSTVSAPSGRSRHTAVWTGAEVVVWGGWDSNSNAPLNTGGRYAPATDSWTPTSTATAPSVRGDHTAVWTGAEMIVWGGSDNTFYPPYLNTGGRYNPATDAWTTLSNAGAPAARAGHTAVWTGTEMMVWGGQDSGGFLNTGGRYNPTADTWGTTSTAGAPSARYEHTAVWTGTEMIVWGGWGSGGYLNTGGRYNPVTNSWAATRTAGAPTARDRHTTLWTGTEMIVWGGQSSGGILNTGGRYNPTTDTWGTTDTAGAPSPRVGHTALWTGSEMVVWGGFEDVSYTFLNTGGRYSPATDSWTSTDTASAPSPRGDHTAVWTGSEMIVWGGWNDGEPSPCLGTGGRYTPASDSWTPTGTAGAPSARHLHTAVWTGTEMVVWGGNDDMSYGLSTGGRYRPPYEATGCFSDDMESGAGGWSVDPAPQNLWHLVSTPTCSPSSHSGMKSWRFGLDDTCMYDEGQRVAGRLKTPTIHGLAADSTLSFWYRRQTEDSGATFDKTVVQISLDGVHFTDLYALTGTSGWTAASGISLSAYAGLDVTLGFWFDSVDGVANGYAGWMVDDLAVNGAGCSYCPAPGAPALNAVGSVCEGIDLSWTAGTGLPVRYSVYRSEGSCPPEPPVRIAGPLAGLTYRDATATAGATYAYTVRATCDTGGATESPDSNCLSATRLGVPAAPAAPVFTAVLCTSQTLRWHAVSGATSYDVWRAQGSTCASAVKITATPVTGTSYGDTGLAGGTPYSYYITANGTCGTSASGACASSPTPPFPVAPTDVVASNDRCTDVQVTWTRSASVSRYDVLRNAWFCTMAEATFADVTSPFHDTTAEGGTAYHYWVVARNGCGIAESACQSGSRLPLPAAPSAPTFAAVTCTSQRVSWVAVPGVARCLVYYDVWRAPGPTCAGAVKVTSEPTLDTFYNDTGLAPETQYSYFVTATTPCGTSAYGACASSSTGPIVIPGSPAAPTFTAVTCTSQTINWTAVPDATSYDVWRSIGPACAGATKITATPVPGTSLTDTDVVGGTQYCYFVTANSPCGVSDNGASASGTLPCCVEGWVYTNQTGAPSSRNSHTAVWTGAEMIVWGGYYLSTQYLNTGARYNPTTGVWTATSTTGAPAGRYGHTAVWTGTEMIVWGGSNGSSSFLNTGARYNPATNTWAAVSTVNAPSVRYLHRAVWTGTEMIVWGGSNGSFSYVNTGGRYNPRTDTWTTVSTSNAPSARAWHSAVWTGTDLIVWGGYGGSYLSTGAVYHPATDTWVATSATGAPSGRVDHSAVWTGTEMILWGGYNGGHFNTGGRYNPSTNAWTPVSTANAPSARRFHTALWIGAEMIVWGGGDSSGYYLSTGGRYTPATDTWTATSQVGVPSARQSHTALWTGTEMIVWGGLGLVTGGRYTPTFTSPVPVVSKAAPNVALNWIAAANAVSYRLYRAPSPDPGNWGAPLWSGTATTATDPVLNDGIDYYYRLVAVDACGAESAP